MSEAHPPPFAPQYNPTAPEIMLMQQNFGFNDQQFNSVPEQGNSHIHPNEAPPQYTPSVPVPAYQIQDPIPNRPPIPSRAPTTNTTPAVVAPLRTKCGFVDVGVGELTDVDGSRAYRRQYVEVTDGVMRMSASRDLRVQANTIQLASRFVSMETKKNIAIQDGASTFVIRAQSDASALKWMLVLAQYCFVAPIMEGFAQKQTGGKNVYEERFLRLYSDGVLAWYGSDNENSDRHGAIQVRGENCVIDSANLKCVRINVKTRDYQFRFFDEREASLWHAAFQWHSARKPLKKASIPIRNKAR
uniref:PH domain-containing protein n=1 Tax=Ciona savignyi TaxID=51511 RepID=H2YJR1_CIOSA